MEVIIWSARRVEKAKVHLAAPVAKLDLSAPHPSPSFHTPSPRNALILMCCDPGGRRSCLGGVSEVTGSCWKPPGRAGDSSAGGSFPAEEAGSGGGSSCLSEAGCCVAALPPKHTSSTCCRFARGLQFEMICPGWVKFESRAC